MRYTVLLLSICLLLLTGCGSEEPQFVPGDLVPIEIPISATELLTLPFPSNLHLIETDNNVYWKFDQDVTVYVMYSNYVGAAMSTQYDDVYVSNSSVFKVMAGCSIVIECPAYMQSVFTDSLGKSLLFNNQLTLLQDYRLKSLPTYNNVEMVLDAHNFYMPKDSVSNDKSQYVSAIAFNEKDWLECWTKDCDAINLELQLTTLASCNTEDAGAVWYKDSDVLYIEYGNNICAAKRLSYNQWYIYYGSKYYKDYILQGIDLIHRSE